VRRVESDIYDEEGRIRPKAANHSRLMRAMLRERPFSVCPHGCKSADHDEHGYCRHVVGITPGVDQSKPDADEIAARGLMEPFEEYVIDVDGVKKSMGWRTVGRPVPVPKGAHLERIASSYRVYTRAGRAGTAPEE
jgi:hypothetical protein